MPMRSIFGFILAAAVVVMASSCGFFDFIINGPEFFKDTATLYVSNRFPAPGEEIKVGASKLASAGAAADHEASFFAIATGPPYEYSATAGLFRELSSYSGPSSSEDGESAIEYYEKISGGYGSVFYWKAPDEPGKVYIHLVHGEARDSIKIFVTAPE
jgi:hypothetical protein